MKKYLITIGVLAVAVGGYGATTAYANPSQIQGHASAAATTTLVYMTPGMATSTNSVDTQVDGGSPADEATLVFQVTATSTGVVTPTVLLRIEDSDNGSDWYSRTVAANTTYPTLAASSTIMSVNEMSFLISTSTANTWFGSNSTTRIHYSVSVPARLRYMRGIFYIPTDGGNIGLWSNLYYKKQNR